RHEILVGCRVTRRTRPEITGAIDVATDPFAVRAELSGDLPFRALLQRVNEAVLRACPQQGCPSREAKLPRPWAADRDSPFQIMFLFQEDSTRAGQPSGRDLRSPERDSDTASCELILDLGQTPTGVCGGLEYAADLFDAASIERMAGHFQTLLGGIVVECHGAPPAARRLGELPLLTPAARPQLLLEGDRPPVPPP